MYDIYANNIVPKGSYVCTECGYIEEWVDKSDIPQLLKSKKARRKIGY